MKPLIETWYGEWYAPSSSVYETSTGPVNFLHSLPLGQFVCWHDLEPDFEAHGTLRAS